MKRKVFLAIFLLSLTLSIILLSSSFVFANEADGTNDPTVGNEYNQLDDYTIPIYGIDHLKRELQYLRNNREDGDTNIYTLVLYNDNNPDYSTDERLSIPSYTCLDLNGNTITYTNTEKDNNGNYVEPNALGIVGAVNVEITSRKKDKDGIIEKRNNFWWRYLL